MKPIKYFQMNPLKDSMTRLGQRVAPRLRISTIMGTLRAITQAIQDTINNSNRITSTEDIRGKKDGKIKNLENSS